MSVFNKITIVCDSCGAIAGPGDAPKVLEIANKNKWKMNNIYTPYVPGAPTGDYCFFCRTDD